MHPVCESFSVFEQLRTTNTPGRGQYTTTAHRYTHTYAQIDYAIGCLSATYQNPHLNYLIRYSTVAQSIM
jgi:hypothetical protein